MCCTVWKRSCHASLKPTNILVSIASFNVKREVSSCVECRREVNDDGHILLGPSAVRQQLKSKKRFIRRITALDKSPSKEILRLWKKAFEQNHLAMT